MDEQARMQQMGDTKRALMQAARHYTQKRINAEKAARRLLRAQISRSVAIPQAEELLAAAEEVKEEAIDALKRASDEAFDAGWSTEDRVFFTQEAEAQVMAADAAGRAGGAQDGGRRKTTRKSSSRHKSATRKYKRTRSA